MFGSAGSPPLPKLRRAGRKGAVMDPVNDLDHFLAKMREFERVAEQSRDPMVRKIYVDWLRQLRELSIDAAARRSQVAPR
jgi:hypothetical protein